MLNLYIESVHIAVEQVAASLQPQRAPARPPDPQPPAVLARLVPARVPVRRAA